MAFDRNAWRRERYANDPVYRDKVLAQNKNHPRKRDGEKEWARQLKRLYGMTVESYNELLRSQDGVCLLCGLECSDGKRLAVDHDHETGVVRGLLCRKCNTGIGMLRHDPAVLRRAAEYLA